MKPGDREIRREKKWENDDLTQRIIQCAITVHNTLGPGFVESIYKNALILEFRKAGVNIETEKSFPVTYCGMLVGCHRADLIVEETVIVELKVVQELGPTHYAQLRSTLRAAGLRVGILVNFDKAVADFRRIDL